MMIRKMAAVLTAAAITATGAAYSGCLNSFTTTYAAEASAEKAETCGVKVSVIAPNHKLPEGITAKLVSVKGEAKTELASWDASAVKEIKDLEYSADADYRITFDGAPEDFFLPEETKVELAGKGSVDKISAALILQGFLDRRSGSSAVAGLDPLNVPDTLTRKKTRRK